MGIGDVAQSPQQVLGTMFIGTAISFVLHGVTCCQVVWYVRTQYGRSSKSMKALVLFIWLGETLNCMFMFHATRNNFLTPAITYAQGHSNPCGHWTGPAQAITSAMCTFSVEGFFIMRVWRLSEKKKLTILAFIPYLAGHGIGIAQIARSFQVLCKPTVTDLSSVLIFGTYGCRLFGDGVIVMTMCYMLHIKSLGFTRHTNTLKIVHVLILWSISTGLLTWLSGVLFLVSYVNLIPGGFGIFYVRGGLYANAMLAQLNARTRFRAMAEESVPFNTINLDTLPSDQRANRESQHSMQ